MECHGVDSSAPESTTKEEVQLTCTMAQAVEAEKHITPTMRRALKLAEEYRYAFNAFDKHQKHLAKMAGSAHETFKLLMTATSSQLLRPPTISPAVLDPCIAYTELINSKATLVYGAKDPYEVFRGYYRKLYDSWRTANMAGNLGASQKLLLGSSADLLLRSGIGEMGKMLAKPLVPAKLFTAGRYQDTYKTAARLYCESTPSVEDVVIPLPICNRDGNSGIVTSGSPGQALVAVENQVMDRGNTRSEARRKIVVLSQAHPGLLDELLEQQNYPLTSSEEDISDSQSCERSGPRIDDMGGIFRIQFMGKDQEYTKIKGLSLLKHLVDNPGIKFSALELRCLAEGADPNEIPQLVDFGPDRQCLARLNRDLKAINVELERAEEDCDMASTERCRAEREFILAEIDSYASRRQRLAETNPEHERARKAVKNAIDYALDKVKTNMPELEAYFRKKLTTGQYCSYGHEERFH